MNFPILLSNVILALLIIVFNKLNLNTKIEVPIAESQLMFESKKKSTSFETHLTGASVEISSGLKKSAISSLNESEQIIKVHKIDSVGEAAQAQEDVVLSFVGDVMLGSAFHSKMLHKEYFLASKVFFEKSDLNFINLEGPIGNDELLKFAKSCTSKNCHKFSQFEESANFLKSQNIHVVALNNNHALDLSINGLINSKLAIERSALLALTGSAKLDSLSVHDDSLENFLKKNYQNLNSLDLKEMSPTKVEKKSIIFSIFNLSSVRQMAQIDAQDVLEKVSRERKAGRIVVVYAHVGCEGAAFMKMPKSGMEQCFSEQRPNAFEMAKRLQMAGAQIIVFHGPHVVRPIIKTKDSIVAYSLGNFATAPGISVEGVAGLAPLLQIGIKKDGSISWCKVISFKQQRTKGLYLDEKQEAKRVIEKLTEEQFERSTGCS